MKKLFFLSILLCFFLSMQAQTTSVNISAGGLSAALSSQTNVTNLVVTGTMDASDFKTIQSLSSTLVTLDLSGITKIAAYSGQGGSDPDNKVTVYPVDQIPYRALYQVSALTTVVLPTNASIASIGAEAFKNCRQLISVNIPNGVSSIGDAAFSNTGFNTFTLPDNVTTLGIGVFQNSSSLTQVTLPSNLTEIPASTFQNSALSSITIPVSVTSIGNLAFYGTKITTITLPSGLQWLGGYRTFYSCFNLTAINNIPAGMQIIDGDMLETFANTQITSFTIPSNVTTIDVSAFESAPLTSLTFPTNSLITSILDYSLSGAQLTSLVIPEKVTTLGEGVLYGASAMKSLELPTSLTAIAADAFHNCSGLTSIKVHNPKPVDLSKMSGVFDGIDKTKCILYVPAGTKAAYQAASSWKDFTNIQELNTTVNISAGGLSAALSSQTNVTNLVVTGTMDASDFKTIQSLSSTLVTLDLSGVTKIAAYSGQGGSDPDNKVTVYPVNQIPYRALYQAGVLTTGVLTTVVLPTNASIASIGAEAFKNCRQLISVNIPNGVSSIGDAAFSNTGFNTFTLPDNVTTLGIGVFQNSSSLTQVTLPSNLTEIPASTFQNSALSSITIPVSVTSIGNLAFYGTKITTITLPSGLQWLGGYRTFYSCFNLTAINNIPAGMQIIDGDMLETFANTQITSFTIPSNVTTIDVSAFESAPLTSLTFPTNSLITSILDYSLSGAQLTSLVIPEKVTTLGEGVLYGASAMKSLELPTSLTAIAADAFHNCSGLTSIKVHNPKPVDLSKMSGVFDGIDKTKCILYVPTGTKAAYQAASSWKDFTNIVEFGTTTGLENVQNNNASLTIAGNPVQGSEAVLTFAEAGEGAVVRVSDLSGKTLLKQVIATGSTTATLSVGNLSKGVYLVNYTDNTGKRGMVKMIK